MVSRRDQASKSAYLLPSEVAEVLQVSPKTVTRWAKEGAFASPPDAGRPPPLRPGRHRVPGGATPRSRSPPEPP